MGRVRTSRRAPKNPARLSTALWYLLSAVRYKPGMDGCRPRTALVLGAGGVLGAAWMTGALPAVQDRLPVPIGEVDLMLGTSAGSVLAAALRCGASIDDLVAYQRGEPVGDLATVGDIGGRRWPRPPRPWLGSPKLVASSLRAP